MTRIHHLNCGTLRPFGRRRTNGVGSNLQLARMVCHCLAVETDRGIVLIDTGFGLDDIREQRRSLVRSLISSRRARGREAKRARLEHRRLVYTRFGNRPRLVPEETALRQVEALGFSPRDVSDIVLTHLDLDHAGGLRDFPRARVHVSAVEHQAAHAPASPGERFRYWAHQWSHGPDWVTYGEGGDSWLGFEGAREIEGLPDIALVPLPGHSRGHSGVALRLDGEGPSTAARDWLLHAGDAYFFHGELDPGAPRSTPGVASFQARMDVDRAARRRNQDRLRQLAAERGAEVSMFCSHDPVEFDRLSAGHAAPEEAPTD